MSARYREFFMYSLPSLCCLNFLFAAAHCEMPPVLSLQCVFLIWCMAPVSWNGSKILYTRVIRPFFLKHEAAMDNVVNNLSSTAKTLTGTVTKEGEMPSVCSTAPDRRIVLNSKNSFTFLHHTPFLKHLFFHQLSPVP